MSRGLRGDKYEFSEEKLAESVEYVGKALRELGPFDGIIGFSQVCELK